MNLKQFDKIVTDQLSRSELVLMGIQGRTPIMFMLASLW